jgi:hypothetical protein
MNEQQAQQTAQIQRRASYRVPVGTDPELQVRAWRIAAHAILRDRPSAKLEIICQALNLSVTGIGLLCRGRQNVPLTLAAGDRLRLQIVWESQEAILEGNITHATESDPEGWARAGVAFKRLDQSIAGRRTRALLDVIVGQLQRAATRRLRTDTKTD